MPVRDARHWYLGVHKGPSRIDCKSGKDPDEKTNDPPETIIANINVKELAATNGTAVITEERLDISSHAVRTKRDHLVIVLGRLPCRYWKTKRGRHKILRDALKPHSQSRAN
jgi:hypothetical protein